MRAAIENLEKINAENKVLILGAMAELGDESLQEHEEIVKLLKKVRLERSSTRWWRLS